MIFTFSIQVLLSLRILLMMKPSMLNRVSHQISYGLHELLKTNAANIHSGDDWYTLFTLLECIGSGVKPPPALQATGRTETDTGKLGIRSSLRLENLMDLLDKELLSVTSSFPENLQKNKVEFKLQPITLASLKPE